MSELEPRLSEADAQKVLARASQLQADHAGTLSVAQLREIASELAIPESAVDQALLEFRGAAGAARAPAMSSAAIAEHRRRNPNPLVLAAAAVGTVFAFLVVVSLAIRLFP